MRTWYVCIKEFVWNGILFQVGVVRAWTEDEKFEFMASVHANSDMPFVQYWEKMS